jgi:protein-tyrosine phosphatase
MNDVFWLLPGVLAGRAGPNREPWRISDFRDAGIRAVLYVNDGELCHPDELAVADIAYRCIPLSANAPPRVGDRDHCEAILPEAYAFVTSNLKLGSATLVHCSSGKDRTALFMAHYLVRSRPYSPAEAVAKVKAVRPIAFTAEGWEPFALEVLAAIGGRGD